ncbi:MAG: efflux RND transporter periplasmic adaptor subunit [Persicimonas sp.]
MKEKVKKVALVVVPLLIFGAAALVAVLLLVTGQEAERAEPRQEGLLVETERVERSTHQLDVQAAGTVVAARDINVEPQVSGRIVEVHDQLTPGGLLEEGEVLFRIDPSDYRLAVEEQLTALAEAKAALEQERGRQEVARREWELFEEEVDGQVGGGPNGEDEDPSLALREPQLRSAEAAVEAAQARLQRARLDLERTRVEAPFDAFVESESIDVGQTVGTQSQVAHLVGTDAFWVRLSVSTDRLPYIDVPGVNAQTGSEVRIAQDVGGRLVERRGRIARLMGDLEETGRMAQLLAVIDDPFSLDDVDDAESIPRGIPLLLNAFVDVEIDGPTREDLIEVPREALDEDDRVRVYEEGRLAIRPVDVVWRRDDSVLVDEGLTEGTRVVTSPIGTPVEGMRLRTGEDTAADAGSDAHRNIGGGVPPDAGSGGDR